MSNKNPIPYAEALALGIVTVEQATIIERHAATLNNRYMIGATVAPNGNALTVVVPRFRFDVEPVELRMIDDLIVEAEPV